jgi:hypothetical protein
MLFFKNVALQRGGVVYEYRVKRAGHNNVVILELKQILTIC